MSADEYTSATVVSIASSASNVTLIGPSVGLRGRIVYNDSSAILYLKFGSVASVTSYTVQVPSQGTFVFPEPLYVGEADGIWASAQGAARITTW